MSLVIAPPGRSTIQMSRLAGEPAVSETASRLPSGLIVTFVYWPGAPTVPGDAPLRSSHVSSAGLAVPRVYSNVPCGDTANDAKNDPASALIGSVTWTGSPVAANVFGSSARAIKALPRLKNTCPAPYAPFDSDGPTTTDAGASSAAILSCGGDLPPPAQKSRCWPSGKNCGQRCEFSTLASMTLAGSGMPPVAGTFRSGSLSPDANTITPRSFHVPPRPVGASQTVVTVPPPAATVFNLPDAKNPIDRPSCDQKG